MQHKIQIIIERDCPKLKELEYIIEEINNTIKIEISNKTINNELKIYAEEIEHLSRTYSVKESELIFDNCTFSKITQLDSSVGAVKKKLIVKNSIIELIEIAGSQPIYLTKHNFKGCTFSEIRIVNNGTSAFNFDLNSGKIGVLFLKNICISENQIFKLNSIEINSFVIKKAYGIKTRIDLSNVTIKYLTILDSNIDGNFIVNNNTIKKVYLKNIEFNKNVSFQDTNTNITKFKEVYFHPDFVADFSKYEINNTEKTNISVFRKIKVLLEKIGNKIEANRYYSYEMRARKFELGKTRWYSNWNDKIIFYTSDTVSHHGLVWYLPIFWMYYFAILMSTLFYSTEAQVVKAFDPISYYFLGSCLYLYIIVLIIYNEISSKNKNRINFVKNVLLRYLMIIALTLFYYKIFGINTEPLLKFFNILDLKETPVNKIIDINYWEKFISKIIMAYLIFHFITALRKDSRK